MKPEVFDVGGIESWRDYPSANRSTTGSVGSEAIGKQPFFGQ